MSVTPAEVVQLLNGEGSAELQARFLRETEDSESALYQMLVATEAWAHQKLNTNSPSNAASEQGEPAAKTYRVIRKAALWADEAPRAAETKDLVDYLRGTASPETIALVKAALADPASELFKLLLLLEQQGK